MIDTPPALEAVVRHAVELEGDYADIEPTVTALAACGDTTLVPRLNQALDRFLDEENFYGRDLIAGILAGIQGAAALPALLRASARDLGDDQDRLSAEIVDLLYADKAAGRLTAIEFAADEAPELRRAGLWALGFVAEDQDADLLAAAATDIDPEIRSVAIGSIMNPAADDRFHQRRYRYVGPADVLTAVTPDGSGHRITSADDLAAWMAVLAPAERSEPHTFVTDVAGDLRVAPRRSEHVACAGGRPVLSAGEISFTRQDGRWTVTGVSNQSTGYCPEPSSWPAVAAACEQAGLEHPGGFTAAFEFRRCPVCGQINIVKDDDLACAACGGDLPREWNVSF